MHFPNTHYIFSFFVLYSVLSPSKLDQGIHEGRYLACTQFVYEVYIFKLHVLGLYQPTLDDGQLIELKCI